MDRAKKKLASALDGLKNSHKFGLELDEKITADDIRLTKVDAPLFLNSFFHHSNVLVPFTISGCILCSISLKFLKNSKVNSKK